MCFCKGLDYRDSRVLNQLKIMEGCLSEIYYKVETIFKTRADGVKNKTGGALGFKVGVDAAVGAVEGYSRQKKKNRIKDYDTLTYILGGNRHAIKE